jgi:hypothetical protein
MIGQSDAVPLRKLFQRTGLPRMATDNCEASMRQLISAVAAFSLIALSGCGTYVPEIEDFGGSTAGEDLVHYIVLNIDCEVRNAVYDLYQQYHGRKEIAFLASAGDPPALPGWQ